jgi:peptide/nickel transport system substrate-binding protein
MRTRSRVTFAAGILAVAATVLAGCGGSSGGGGGGGGNNSQASGPSASSSSGGSPGTTGYNAASQNVVDKSTKSGGTMKLLAGGDCDSWDPARTYYGW